jgi:Frequency clock protein
LTIENKRLKRKLRTYEKSHNDSSHNEALFEVRFHGLPSNKRRELEELLRNFVTKASRSPRQSDPSPSTRDSAAPRPSPFGYSTLGSSNIPSSLLAGPYSSHSHSRVVDSGYASLTFSGQPLSARSGKGSVGETGVPIESDRTKEIHNYLSDIPVGLLPTRSGPMTERERKKSVVRKLEQLFAGRDSSGAHQHPKQQERLAQSAARHDRRVTEASGVLWQPEGTREARIMLKEGDAAPINDPSPTSDSRSKSDDRDTTMIDDHGDDDDDLFEQRPTRPLDLDPYRAQVPAENMQYIRHLGFSPPDEVEMEVQPDGHGWIHLNVLTNMAQLHFMNVTPHFVQKSISDYSKMLELSPDGRKVRWKGGKRVTISRSSSSPDQEVGSTSGIQSKHLAGFDRGSSLHLSERSAFSRRQRNKLAYSPIFRTREDSEADTGMDDEMNYQFSNPVPASTGLASSSKRNILGKQRAAIAEDPATLIFYQDFGFYTDLNGGPLSEGGKHLSNYKRVATAPVGAPDAKGKLERLRKMEYEKGPLSQPKPDNLSSSGREESSASPMESGLKVILPTRKSDNSTSPSSVDPIDLEASGIGGVEPADNFSINVRSLQHKGDTLETSSFAKQRSKAYPVRIRNALLSRGRNSSAAGKGISSPTATGSSLRKFGTTRSVVQREIIGSKRTDLPASALPAAVFYHRSSDDEDDDDDEDDEDDDVNYGEDEDTTESDEMPKSAPQHMDWAAGVASKPSSGSESEDNDDDDDDDDDDDFSDDDEDKIPRTRSTNLPKIISGATIRPMVRKNRKHTTIRPTQPLVSSGSSESIDLLATARSVDQHSIRRRDREFDATIADRLAEIIPAGSSAATADGGSGFASPAYKRDTSGAASASAATDSPTHQQPSMAAVVAAAMAAARGEMPPPLTHQHQLTQRERGGNIGSKHGVKRSRRSDEGSTPRARKSPKFDQSGSESS